MKDIIDQRNEKERISRSIIKRWNVNYVPQSQTSQPEQECNDAAQEILSRLAREAAMDEAQRQAEIDRALAEYSERERQRMYNEKNAHSGYGQADDANNEQIEKILHEKADAIRRIIDQGGNV